MPPLKELRQQLRVQRRLLSDEQRRIADAKLQARITGLAAFRHASRIAGYLACGGEFDPAPILAAAWAARKSVYLPVLTGRGQPMLFAPYTPTSELVANWLKIPEPVVPREQLCRPEELDLVLAPLVGFDAKGGRLGMGGGYYDRSFAFLNQGSRGRPWLLGVAYELQKLDAVALQPWDVPLDAVATEAALYQRSAGRSEEGG